MARISMQSMFKTPKQKKTKKTKTMRECAPKVPYNTCQSKSKVDKCQWVHGKREYCRTRKNKKRT